MILTDQVSLISQGAAAAGLFAVFCTAGVGKLLGCRRGVGTMCGKSAMDFGMAVLAVVPWPPAMLVAGGLGLAIGIGGWVIEVTKKNPVCRCFGVMNAALHRFRNQFRSALAVSGSILLTASFGAHTSVAEPPASVGALFVLAAALLLITYAAGAAMLGPKAVKLVERSAESLTPEVSLMPDQHAGQLPGGQPVTLANLVQPGQPLAILFSAPGCGQCEAVKSEISAFRAALPFPLRIIDSGKSRDQPADLADQDSLLRRRLAITGVPTLVVIDPATFRVTAPFATGPEAIRQQMMRLLVGALSRVTTTPEAAAAAPSQ